MRQSFRHLHFLRDVELRVPVIGVVELAEAWVGRAATADADGGRSQRAVAGSTALFARDGGRGGSGVAGGVVGERVVVGGVL